MEWLQITIETTAAHGEYAAELLSAAGAQAVTLRGGDAPAVYEPGPGETPLWAQVEVTGLFDAPVDAPVDTPARAAAICAGLQTAAAPGVILALHTATLPDRQWERSCLQDFKPLRFGAHTWVCPSWCAAPAAPGDVVITLDPGLAFGTGGHATTALCLEWLDGHGCRGCRVIDYGCGSGLLGIAAARHGAAQVWCVDHDPQALTATRANAQINGVAALLHPCLPEGLPAVQADVLLANILAAPLIALAPAFAALLRPGGAIVLSGLLTQQIEAVAAAYRPWFTLDAPRRRQDWALLGGTRH